MKCTGGTEVPRRQYGTGSITQRKDGLWVARIEAGWSAQGTRRRITVSAKTEAACKAKLKAKQREIATTGLPAAGTARATVKTWADEWLPRYQREVRPGTYVTNSGLIRRWVIPTIGSRRLTDLTPADVRAIHTAVTKAGRSSTTGMHAHTVLVRMLKSAVAEGHAVPPRLFEVKRPSLAVNDREAIPTPHARAILAAARHRDDYARWVAALLQGMRQGEVLGLTWDAIDLGRSTVDVSWQLQTLPYTDKRDRAKGFVVPEGYEARHLHLAAHLVRPKSTKGKRLLPLVPWLAGELTAARDRWPHNPWGLVWTETDPKGRQIPVRDAHDRHAWHQLQEAAGVAHPTGRPYHLHEARHTTATLLLEEGVDPHVIEAILGHSSIVTSRGYMHASQELARRALESVAARLDPAVTESRPASALDRH